MGWHKVMWECMPQDLKAMFETLLLACDGPQSSCRDALLAAQQMSAQTSGTGALSEAELAPQPLQANTKSAQNAAQMQTLLEQTLTRLRSTGVAATSRRDTLELIRSIVRFPDAAIIVLSMQRAMASSTSHPLCMAYRSACLHANAHANASGAQLILSLDACRQMARQSIVEVQWNIHPPWTLGIHSLHWLQETTAR